MGGQRALAPVLASVASGSVVVAALASCLTGLQGASVTSAVPATAVQVPPGTTAVAVGAAAPALLDLAAPGPVRLGVLAPDRGAVRVESCPTSWRTDGSCPGARDLSLTEPAVLAGPVAHLRVSAAAGVSLVLSR